SSARANTCRNNPTFAAKSPRIIRSVGAKPKSGVTATRSRDRSISAGGWKSPGRCTARPCTVAASGSQLLPLAIEPSSRHVFATVRAIGPSTGRLVQPIGRLSLGTSPGEGRNPTIPQNAAGLRNDPPVSDPVHIGAIPVASATADPPEDPAQDFVVSNGLAVTPYTALRVLAPAPNSGVLVLPITIAPARRASATMRSSATGT